MIMPIINFKNCDLFIKSKLIDLMNMKYEDFEKETNMISNNRMKKKKVEESVTNSVKSNRFMTQSQLSGLSRSSSLPVAHIEYEKIMTNYENEIRNHIKNGSSRYFK